MNSNTKKRLTVSLLSIGAVATFLASDASAQRNRGNDKADQQKTERKAPPLQPQAQPEPQKRVEAQRQQRQIQPQPQPMPPQRQVWAQQRQIQPQPQPMPPQRQVWAQQQRQQQRQIQAQQQQQQVQIQQQNQILQAQQRQIAEQNRQIQLQNAQRQNVWQQNQNNRRVYNDQRIVTQPNSRFDRDQQEQLRQQSLYQYNQHWNDWQNISKERYRELQQERRNAYLAYQQRYWERLRRDQLRLQQAQYYDNYYNNYSYYRDGDYYYTSQYGAQMLRDAVNNGYEEGFYEGQADRRDGWRFDYEGAYGYQDAALGYDSYYVSYDDYNYYFREGFRRGYEDGYYGRYQYGRYSNGKYAILGAVLGTILDLSVN